MSRKSGRWICLWEQMVDDPKVQRLPPALFKMLINLWCLTSQNNGRLPAPADIAFKLHLSERRVAAMLHTLRTVGLLDVEPNGNLIPHNWEQRQFARDLSTDRVRKHRNQRLSTNGNGDETFHDRSTTVSETSTIIKTSTETERETERATTPSENLIFSSTAADAAVVEKRDLKQAAPYAFEGHIVRLRQNDYERWRRTYPKIINFDAELQRIDDWHQSHPEQSDGWFYRTSNWLKRSNDEAESKRKEELRRQGRAW